MTTATWHQAPRHRTGAHQPLTRPGCETTRAALVEDVEWLASFGTCFVEIARRLGKAPGALERALHRAGRPDLAALNAGHRYRG